MTTYDDYITGLHDDNSPMNRKEILSEIEEEQQEYETEIETLERRNKNLRQHVLYLKKQLSEAGGIIEMYRATGKLKESELNRLTEIFEPYLTN